MSTEAALVECLVKNPDSWVIWGKVINMLPFLFFIFFLLCKMGDNNRTSTGPVVSLCQ